MKTNIKEKIKYWEANPHISYKTKFGKQDTDFEIVCSVQDSIAIPPDNIPDARNKFSGIMYNQPDVNENSCSCHGPATALSSLTNIRFTTQQIKSIWDQEVANGNASPDWGGYSYKMVDAWRKWWNTTWSNRPDLQVASMAVEMGSPLFYKLLDKGYLITSGYRWIEGYDQDWVYDTLINKQWDSDPEQEKYGKFLDGGHCLSWARSDKYAVKGHKTICVDNYNTTPVRVQYNNNIYGIEDTLIPTLCSNPKIWHEWGYVFMFKSDIEKANLKINTKLLQRLSQGRTDSGRIVYCKYYNQYGVVQNNELKVFSGRDISELFKVNYGSTNETYCLGLTKQDWDSINTNKVI